MAQVAPGEVERQRRRAVRLLLQAARVGRRAAAQADVRRDVHILGGLLLQALQHADLGHGGGVERHQRADRGGEDRSGDDGQQGAPLRQEPGEGQMEREPDGGAPELLQAGPTRIQRGGCHPSMNIHNR